MVTTLLDGDKDKAYQILGGTSASAEAKRRLKAELEAEQAKRRVQGQNKNIAEVNARNEETYKALKADYDDPLAKANKIMLDKIRNSPTPIGTGGRALSIGQQGVQIQDQFTPANMEESIQYNSLKSTIKSDALKKLQNFEQYNEDPMVFEKADIDTIAKQKAKASTRTRASSGSRSTILSSN